MGEIVDTVLDVGEVDLPPLSGSYRPPFVEPGKPLVLVGDPFVRCNIQGFAMSRIASGALQLIPRLVEDWDVPGTFGSDGLQARYNGNLNAAIEVGQRVEVHMRTGRRVLCAAALVVEEAWCPNSPAPRFGGLIPLKADTEEGFSTRPSQMWVHPKNVFRGYRLLCEAVHGALHLVRVHDVMTCNVGLFFGEGSVSAGIFHSSVSPQVLFPVMHPANRVRVLLSNYGPEPARVRVRIEGKEWRET
jgi:hypothetical protein